MKYYKTRDFISWTKKEVYLKNVFKKACCLNRKRRESKILLSLKLSWRASPTNQMCWLSGGTWNLGKYRLGVFIGIYSHCTCQIEYIALAQQIIRHESKIEVWSYLESPVDWDQTLCWQAQAMNLHLINTYEALLKSVEISFKGLNLDNLITYFNINLD